MATHTPATIDPPNVGSVGRLRGLLRTWWWRRKVAKKGDAGYVLWYLVDGSWPAPKLVKPEVKQGNVPEYKHNGETYLFPRKAMVPDSDTGLWVCIHRKGAADPINPTDANELAIDTSTLKDYLDKTVTAEPPGGFLSRLFTGDLDGEQILWLLIAGIIGVALIQELTGGGFL